MISWATWGRLNIEMSFYRYMDPHVKDGLYIETGSRMSP